MKLEVGMYVRFNNGDIGKIANYEYREEYTNGHVIYLEKDETIGWCCEEKDFKASYNIIDLIEVGDYVNGFPVIHKKNDILKCGLLVKFKKNEIKSIVTKEQFESIKYSLEG